VVDGGTCVSAQLNWRDMHISVPLYEPLAVVANPGISDAFEVETEDYANIEKRLVANRAAREQVLDGFLVTVCSVGKLCLGHLFLNHRRTDERDRGR
jgi:hypothetical protein